MLVRSGAVTPTDELVAALLALCPDPTLVVDHRGVVRYANQAMVALLGHPVDDLVDRPLDALLPPATRARHDEHLRRYFADPRPQPMGSGLELEAMHRDGRAIPVEISLGSVATADGLLVAAALRDISARRAAHRELTEANERLGAALGLAQMGVWELDLTTDRRVYSPQLLAMLGMQESHADSDAFFSSLHPDDRPLVAAATERAVRERGSYQITVRVRRADGELRWLETSARVVCGDDGAPARVQGVVRDVTERREVEAQLATADRMASLGLVAASVAHEINNPLAAIVGNVDLLTAGRPPDGAAREPALADIREAAARIRAIARDLRMFSRVEREERVPVDVVSVLESTLRMARAELRHRATVECELAPVPPVSGSESRLGQVFLNLLVNAAQSIGDGGGEAGTIRVSTGLDAGRRVVVTIADTGSGMAPETVARLFTPFFTTKPAGEGTGLGLTICRRIVLALGGDITVTSELGVGSEFRVHLPIAAGPSITAGAVAGAGTAPSPIAPRAPRARILIIDDEPILTRTLTRALAADHDVVAHNHGHAALELLAQGAEFDVILCDLMMPDLSGMAVYTSAIEARPELASRFVFMTGGVFAESARTFLASGPFTVLEKPIDLPAMRTLITARVDRARSTLAFAGEPG